MEKDKEKSITTKIMSFATRACLCIMQWLNTIWGAIFINAAAPSVQTATQWVQVMESNNDILPEEVMLKIFEYLDLPQLCRAGRVCKRWYEFTRFPQFWRRINMNISNNSLFRMFEILPPFVTYIRLSNDDEFSYIKFATFTNAIQRNCPNLETLIMHRFSFFREYLDFHSNLPKNLRALVLTSCKFFFEGSNFRRNEFENKSAYVWLIEVLDLSHSRFTNYFDETFVDFGFGRMSNLKTLHLANCDLSYSIFEKLSSIISEKNLRLLNLEQNNIGESMFFQIFYEDDFNHLTVLYVCWTSISDIDLLDKEPTDLPNLKIICLRGCYVTPDGINSFVLSSPSLERLIVGNEEFNPEFNYSVCNTEIVNIINGYRHCNHNKTVESKE